MDLSQTKLTKDEWNALEIPIVDREFTIIKMIRDSGENINICKKCYNINKLYKIYEISINFIVICILNILRTYYIKFKRKINISHMILVYQRKIKKLS